MSERAKLIRMIRRHKHFLVTSHVNPEGDSLGSALALRRLLLKLGKRVEVVLDGPVPGAYRFLPDISVVKQKPSGPVEAGLIVDCPILERIGRVSRFLEGGKPIGVIDHHISNERFGTVNWVEPEAAAVGEMLFALFKAMRVKVALPEAIHLYVSIVTDTGSFRYSNTTAHVHKVTSELVRLGVDPAAIARNLYESHSFSSRRLLARTLKTLRLDCGGKVASLEVTRRMLASCQGKSEETEGFVDFARSLKRVQVAVFFREEKNGGIKISFRSKGKVNVNRIASRFGGGGHRAASGCMVPGSLTHAKKRVLSEVRKALSR